MGRDEIKNRFREMLGKNADAFMNACLNLIRSDSKLAQCEPESLKAALMIPATLKLSVEKSLGQCYVIAYKDKATVQIGYKGLVQLCIRSGQYKHIHCSEIYADEIRSHNPITGQVKFKDPSTFKLRAKGSPGDVVGHYAYFSLISGFEKADYMTVAEVMAHAEKFSQAYQYDLRAKKKLSPWSLFPIPMGNKTVLKRLLSKFGIMSVEIQKAIAQDDSFEQTEEAARKRIEVEQGSEPVEAEFEKPEEKPKKKKKAAEQKQWYCNGKTRHEFDEPVASGQNGEVLICPECLISDIHLTADEKPDFMKDKVVA
jgi:recombination protein RecT